MTKYLCPLLLLLVVARPAPAARIPYYRMASLAYQSSDVVLCEEVRYGKKTEPWVGGHEYYEATFTVVQAIKGACRPKERLTVELGLIYTRRLTSSWGEEPDKSPPIPMGRALLFLTRDKGVWRPVPGGAKLIIKGEVYCYGQFLGNPGPLWLARMAPENIEVPDDTPYGEDLLLKDLAAALDKAKGLTKAVDGIADERVTRKAPRRK